MVIALKVIFMFILLIFFIASCGEEKQTIKINYIFATVLMALLTLLLYKFIS